MNQILVTKKLYVTPELKRKKKIYSGYFYLSCIISFILLLVAIYFEYDRNKSEEVSQEILKNLEVAENMQNQTSDDTIMVILNNEDISNEYQEVKVRNLADENTNNVKYTSEINGFSYTAVAQIHIPKININYPIIKGETGSKEEMETLLKISPIEFDGNGPNEVGNYCVAGHNYRNDKFFSKVLTLEIGDTITLDANGKSVDYAVYKKYEVQPEDMTPTYPNTNEKKEITLVTCTNDSLRRVIVKAVAI